VGEMRGPWDEFEVKLVLGLALMVLIWLISLVAMRRWRRS